MSKDNDPVSFRPDKETRRQLNFLFKKWNVKTMTEVFRRCIDRVYFEERPASQGIQGKAHDVGFRLNENTKIKYKGQNED